MGLNAIIQTDLWIKPIIVKAFRLLESFEPIEIKNITILTHSDLQLTIVELDVLKPDEFHKILGVD